MHSFIRHLLVMLLFVGVPHTTVCARMLDVVWGGSKEDSMSTAEQKVKAAEKNQTERSAALTGAQAVADAVSRVANAAVAEVSKSEVVGEGLDFVITAGKAGGTFHIRGDGFTGGGSVLIDGKAQQTFEWGDEYIRGKLDDNVKSGEVIVWIDKSTQQRGYLKL